MKESACNEGRQERSATSAISGFTDKMKGSIQHGVGSLLRSKSLKKEGEYNILRGDRKLKSQGLEPNIRAPNEHEDYVGSDENSDLRVYYTAGGRPDPIHYNG
ncbi:hypothetical protein K493DRAFT_304030 [Basidiobolus meristosporus CBS 931.73]|uniref:Uncharacterized protein n=1 Tax=Basidiobolus meristosporus CBS 931.73 TaxID=1314790 RepID=A0A1Y1Y0E7_9FUNG|nr:hypothetical protein K493DRAFT_304030 [Basidiobolus meristosporus CBS 931.73]|eukprot:ORX91492.1 hypothetical protein K493DRAFT_304030 [Basidiobolus meristosporus CBS 931.73]